MQKMGHLKGRSKNKAEMIYHSGFTWIQLGSY